MTKSDLPEGAPELEPHRIFAKAMFAFVRTQSDENPCDVINFLIAGIYNTFEEQGRDHHYVTICINDALKQIADMHPETH